MNKSIALLAAIGLQLLVLVGMLGNASLPLWTGEEIKLHTTPIDPRSLFRGNYARLNYEISNLPADSILNLGELRYGEVVYVKLTKDADGIHGFESLSLTEPDQGVFIRGRFQGNSGISLNDELVQTVRIKYGIEAYFAPKVKAIALENRLRASGAIAKVMVTSSGKPALHSIEES